MAPSTGGHQSSDGPGINSLKRRDATCQPVLAHLETTFSSEGQRGDVDRCVGVRFGMC
jgi:hypothetical protein